MIRSLRNPNVLVTLLTLAVAVLITVLSPVIPEAWLENDWFVWLVVLASAPVIVMGVGFLLELDSSYRETKPGRSKRKAR